MAADYNVLAGRFWPLVLHTIGFAPYLYHHFGSHEGQRVQHPA